MTRLCALLAALALLGCDRAPARRHVDHHDDPVATSPAAAAPALPAKVAPPRPAQVRQVWLKALGMTCEESCPTRVRYALADITGIYQLGFDPGGESIYISYDGALGEPKAATQPMLDAIRAVGYDPWLKQEGWPAGAEVQVVLR